MICSYVNAILCILRYFYISYRHICAVVDSNAMTINCMDNLGGTLNLRISDGVHVYDREGSGFDRILDPMYFQVEGETFNVTGALLRFESMSGNVSYQVNLCKNADLVFND